MADDFADMVRAIKRLPPRQFAALSAVCINQDGGLHPRTLEALERKGLVRSYEERLPSGRLGVVLVKRWDVADYSVHMAWAQACTEMEVERGD